MNVKIPYSVVSEAQKKLSAKQQSPAPVKRPAVQLSFPWKEAQ